MATLRQLLRRDLVWICALVGFVIKQQLLIPPAWSQFSLEAFPLVTASTLVTGASRYAFEKCIGHVDWLLASVQAGVSRCPVTITEHTKTETAYG